MTTYPPHPPNSLQQPVIVHVNMPERRRGPHHILHAILTLFTAGLWIPFWLLITLFSRRGN